MNDSGEFFEIPSKKSRLEHNNFEDMKISKPLTKVNLKDCILSNYLKA